MWKMASSFVEGFDMGSETMKSLPSLVERLDIIAKITSTKYPLAQLKTYINSLIDLDN